MAKHDVTPNPPSGPGSDELEALSTSIQRELQRVLRVWFPRCLDRDDGGFLCDFDFRWNPLGEQKKMLEYQARQTRTAAWGASFYGDTSLREAAMHGYQYLRDVMWDGTDGGWYRMLSRSGEVLESEAKHSHGSSYGIAACVACYELSGDRECLDLAMRGFDWIQEHGRDRNYGGFFPAFTKTGDWIDKPDASSEADDRDPLGIPYGTKCFHTMVDLLDCFAELYRVNPTAGTKEGLQSLLDELSERVITPPGVVHAYYHPDWTPLPGPVRYAHWVQFASELVHAASVLDPKQPDPSIIGKAQDLLNGTLRHAWDQETGGIIYAGGAFGPMAGDDLELFSRGKIWWPQAELLRSLAVMARVCPHESQRYIDYFKRCWQHISRYLVDNTHHGWLKEGTDTATTDSEPKATMWKDASHEVRAMIESLNALDELRL